MHGKLVMVAKIAFKLLKAHGLLKIKKKTCFTSLRDYIMQQNSNVVFPVGLHIL